MIVDDRYGRAEVRSQGVAIIGTAAALVLAKEWNLIPVSAAVDMPSLSLSCSLGIRQTMGEGLAHGRCGVLMAPAVAARFHSRGAARPGTVQSRRA